jgi:hypothetical protein
VIVLIQEIRSIWSKVSRGGAAAALRNSVPEAALFPTIKAKPAAHQIFHHLVVYGEANDFAVPVKSESVELATSSNDIGCVKINVLSERVAVAYEYNYKCGGLPPRQVRPGVNVREEVMIEPGSWVRVRYNGRFSGDEWWYEKVVVNVGLLHKPDTEIFISTEPLHEISQMAELW